MDKTYNEDTSSHGLLEPNQRTAAYTLDEKRREALREVDEANFSLVFSNQNLSPLTFRSAGGSTSKLPSSQVLASSPMRMSFKSQFTPSFTN